MLVNACHVREVKPAPEATANSLEQQQAAAKHRGLGDTYFQKKRLPDALAEWHLALELDPGCPGVEERIRHGEIGMPPGESAALSLSPQGDDLSQRVTGELEQAEKHYRESRLKEAELSWERVLTLSPATRAAQQGLDRLRAETYQEKQDRPFDRMTEDLYQGGMNAYRRSDWALAEPKLAEAFKLNPDQPQVKKYLAQVRQALAQQNQQEEIAVLKAEAETAEKTKQWAKARGAWLRVSQLDPDRPEAQAGLSRTTQALESWAAAELQAGRDMQSAGRWKEALEHYQNILDVLPAHVQALKESRRIRETLSESKNKSASLAEAAHLFNEGVNAYRKGDAPAAIRSWEAALAANPNDAECKQWLARAKNELQEAREQNKKKAGARYADGLAAYQRGELDEALSCWKEALELDPEHEKARSNIQRVQQEMK
jgi:tetratricopeptide (TPR) repeat protein